MAFQIIEQWQVSRRSWFSVFAGLSDTMIFKYRGLPISIGNFQKPISLLLASVMHIFLVIFLIDLSQSSLSNDNLSSQRVRNQGITVMELNDNISKEEKTIKKIKPKKPPQTSVIAPKIFIEKQLPVEWTVSKIYNNDEAPTAQNSSSGGLTANDDNYNAICASGEVDVLENDTDAAGSALKIIKVSDGMGAVIKNNKIILQTAYTGELTYTIMNEDGLTATAIVDITNNCS